VDWTRPVSWLLRKGKQHLRCVSGLGSVKMLREQKSVGVLLRGWMNGNCECLRSPLGPSRKAVA
jgi:hypothetical protein